MTALLRVVKPGLLTSVQDLGRPNAAVGGVSPGGSMDRFAHRAANLLVRNDPGAATLECTIRGPKLVAETECLLAIAGADLDPRVNGEPVETWTGILLRAGDALSFGTRRLGARAYIAIAGGVVGDRWLGSLSTNVLAARGGMHGRLVQSGDGVAAANAAGDATPGRTLARNLRPDYGDHTLHAIAGPHFKSLSVESQASLFDSTFHVSAEADRMGYRLDGPVLVATYDEVLSFGLVTGAVQVPRGGRPILLMADHQTAGGYAVAATVVSASLPIAAQLVPGDELHFSATTAKAALDMRTAREAALATLR